MRDKVVCFILSFINKNRNITKEENEIIKYGLETFYIVITKTLLIALIMACIGMLDAFLLFFITYGVIRTFSFGVHAGKSWICTIISILIYMIVPSLCKYIDVPIYGVYIIGLISILILGIFSPADTEKRPIISPKRRLFYRTITLLIAIIYFVIAIVINNSFISNLFLFALVVQSIMVAPTTYRLLDQQYNNYRFYND